MDTKSLLLVDDDSVFRKFVVHAFGSLPVSLREAPNGKGAAQLLAAAPPDVILLDGLLPDMDGIQFIERHRELIGKIPVIFISSFWKDLASFTTLTQGLRVASVLHKPVRAAVLVDAVAKLVGGLGLAEDRPVASSARAPFGFEMPGSFAIP